MTTYTKDDTIFVQIPSFRDPELQHTLQDLFKKAKKPENIFVGICHQYDMKGDEDKNLFEIPFPRPKQIRVIEFDYKENAENAKLGGSWSRNQAQVLYKDEKWILAIDSHMRFTENWDEIIVTDIKKICLKGKNRRVIFSNVPGTYNIGGELNFCSARAYQTIWKIDNFLINKFFRTWASDIPGKFPLPGITIAGCFYFGDGKTISENIINPFIECFDEVSLAVTFFKSGADIYQYEKNVVGQMWREDNKVNLEAQKHKQSYHTSARAEKIFFHYLGVKKSDDMTVLENIKKYFVAEKRTLRDHERYSGVSFKARAYREHSKQNIFEQWRETAKISEVKNLFKI